ncbi:PTS transporter subunit EIIC [Clostridium botulinum]|nr:PTS transporter subunit EIIC [Clostridium botulinum]
MQQEKTFNSTRTSSYILSTFLYQFGSYVDPSGIKYFGDFSRYFHGDPTAGVFMASEFPILMFGLPGAAIAMICAAEKQNRKKALSIMLSAALVSFLQVLQNL